MAAMLQLAEMTPQWSRALVRGGLASPADFAYRSLEQLRGLFGQDRESPSDAQLLEMVKDAMVVSNRGCISGTILDPDGQLLPGATVAAGSVQGITDPRGRFRLIRVAWWAEISLLVRHESYPLAQFQITRILPEGTVYEQSFQLAAAPDGIAGPAEFMEVRGECLPLIGDARPVERQVDRGDLMRHDILAVVERSVDDDEVKLVSKLWVWADGRFEARYAWLPASDSPSVQPGDCYVVGPDGLQPVEMDPSRLRTYVGLLRARRQAGPPPEDGTDPAPWLERFAEALSDDSIMWGRRF
jgi:hypothetical protein